MPPISKRLDDASKQQAQELLSDDYAQKLIRRKSRAIASRFASGFVGGIDPSEIEQELLLQLVGSSSTFDPSRGHPRAFVKTIVERRAVSIERLLNAAKRSKAGICSLNILIPLEGEAPIELAATITQRELDARTGAAHRDEHDAWQLRQDCAEAIASLDYGPRELARALKHKPLAQIAREWGIPRTTLRAYLPQILERLEDGDLQDYLS